MMPSLGYLSGATAVRVFVSRGVATSRFHSGPAGLLSCPGIRNTCRGDDKLITYYSGLIPWDWEFVLHSLDPILPVPWNISGIPILPDP